MKNFILLSLLSLFCFAFPAEPEAKQKPVTTYTLNVDQMVDIQDIGNLSDKEKIMIVKAITEYRKVKPKTAFTQPDKVYIEECNDSGGCWYAEYQITSAGQGYIATRTGNCAFSSTGTMLHTCTGMETPS